ncbi:hypothetical protein HYT52_03490 [Candidatus Woesearchaeota archaeon]|nr:hypothetical protein [Candidatus Woesearchaeota archaeon]
MDYLLRAGRVLAVGLSLAIAGCVVYSQTSPRPERDMNIGTIELERGVTVDPKGIDTDGNGIADAIRLLYHDHLTGNSYETVDKNLDGVADHLTFHERESKLETKVKDENYDGFFEEVLLIDEQVGILQRKRRYLDGSSMNLDYSPDGKTTIISLYHPGEQDPSEIKIVHVGEEPRYWTRELGWMGEEDHEQLELWKKRMGLIEEQLDLMYMEMKQLWKERVMPDRRDYQEEEQEGLQREL